MHILFLGHPCSSIEQALQKAGHSNVRIETAFDTIFLEEQAFDFGVSYRYKHIIRKPEIDWFRGKLVNLHISYLPWNKGADPNLWSWVEDTPKGVTIHKIDEGCDTGDILLQEQVLFTDNIETLHTSYMKLSSAVEQLFISNMQDIFFQKIRASKQVGKGSFHFSKQKKSVLHLLEKEGWHTSVKNLIHVTKSDI